MTDVYRLANLYRPEQIRDLFERVSELETGALVAVKLHMGELINYRFIRPPFVRELVAAIRAAGATPFLTDTTTLYTRDRHNAVDYLNTARQNGFNFATVGAPVIIADGLTGESGVLIGTGGKLVKEIEVGQAIYEADYLVTVTHCTGHPSTGYAGALKNLGMGCCTKNGKRAVHRFSIPEFDETKCEQCPRCIEACPYSFIQMDDDPVIDPQGCVGCARCIKACPTGAMHRPHGWYEQYMTALIEAANAIQKHFANNICFINFLTDVTTTCDCIVQQRPFIPDLGALASRDVVSIEQASFELIQAAAGPDAEAMGVHSEIQFALAEQLRLGTRSYTVSYLE
ncbi:MAG TPA: DUF362 domain-containing protein [Methanomicrobia archaeon]|nr:DUF362 domain-containing protein [Methanomicrobia archaeon]